MSTTTTNTSVVPSIEQVDAKDIEVLTVGKDVQKRELDFNQYIRRSAQESDYNRLIDHSIIVKDIEGRPVIVYLEVPELPSVYMVNRLKSYYFDMDKRTQGLVSRSKTFGYAPRETIRRDFCSSAALARQDPDGHNYICKFGALLSKFYEKYCPDTFQMHMGLTTKRILDDWRIDDSPFTSGIINKNIALKYHLDAGNIHDVYSNMVCFKKDCSGGSLAIPEYNIGLEIKNKSILLFDGQKILHGVTPFRLTSLEAYRYTLVYYTLKSMWACKPVDEELTRIRQKKLEREVRRYKRLTGELKPEDDPLTREFANATKQRARRKQRSEERQLKVNSSQVSAALTSHANNQ